MYHSYVIYQFLNTKTGEIKDVVQSMKDYRHYKGENGQEDFWERVYALPQVNIGNAKSDPFNQQSFIDKTGSMKGSYGDLLDYSSELSEKRAEKIGGEDPLKRNYFDNYKKKTNGKKHVKDRPNKVVTKNATIEY
jgi:hypothetical protein